MSEEKTINTARALIDAFNKRDFSIWEQNTADNLVADYPGAHSMSKGESRSYNLSFFEAFLDGSFDVHRTIKNNDTVIFQATAHGTFTKPLVTPKETISPTGKKLKIPFILITQVRDEKVIYEQVVWDQLEVFQQLGIIPVK